MTGTNPMMSDVAIVATERSDVALVTDLLRNSGVDDIKVLIAESTAPPLGGRAEKTLAVVVCYRKSSHGTEVILPKYKEASRLIVLSDCIAENTVVKLLKSGARHVFNIRESSTLLQARLEAALRLHRTAREASFEVDDLRFDMQLRRVLKNGRAVDLSPKEFEFACRVFRNIDKIVTNAELMTLVWSLPRHMDTRRIDTAACRVRKKLCLSPENGWLLKRIRCVGYRLSRVTPG